MSRRILVLALLALSVGTGSRCIAQEETERSAGSERLAAIGILAETLKPDSHLFGFTITEFSTVENDSLQQQFLQKNLVTNKSRVGVQFEILDDYVENESFKRSMTERIERLRTWLRSFEKDGLLPPEQIQVGLVYLDLREAIHKKGDPVAGPTTNQVFEDALIELNKDFGQDPWVAYLTGLALQYFQVSTRKTRIEKDKEFYFNKASLEAKNDAQLHYMIGRAYLDSYDRADVSNFLRLVATEMEKCLLIESTRANKELWSTITGLYVQIHEEYQTQDTAEPFWFEELVYKRIIKLDPTNGSAHNNLSFLYSQTGVNLKEALKEAQIANQLAPENAYLLDTLGWAQYKNRLLNEALETLHKAEGLNSEIADVHFHLATVYFDLNDLEKAAHHFKETIRLEPDNAFALNNLAYLFAEHGVQLEEALTLVGQALQKFPDNAAFVDTRGWILYKLGRYEDAEKDLKKAIELMSDSSELFLHLGQVYMQLGRVEDAVQQFDRALALEPENEALARNLAFDLARWGIRTSLERFRKIGSIGGSRDKLKIFYDLLLQSYTAQGNYDGARAILQELQGLPTDPTPSPEVPPAGAETSETVPSRIEVPADQGALGLTALLPRSMDAVFCFEKEGLVDLIDLFTRNLEAGEVPAGGIASATAGIRAVIEGLAVGARFPEGTQARCGFIVVQLTQLAQDAMGRVQNLGSIAQKMILQQLPIPMEVQTRLEDGHTIHEVTAGHHRFFFALSGQFLGLGCELDEVVQFLEGGPGEAESFYASQPVQELTRRRHDIQPVTLVFDMTRFPRPPVAEAPWIGSLAGLSAVAAQWSFAEENALVEEVLAIPAGDIEAKDLIGILNDSLRSMRDEMVGLIPHGIELMYQFEEDDGVVLGSIQLKGLSAVIDALVKRFREMGLPAPIGGP